MAKAANPTRRILKWIAGVLIVLAILGGVGRAAGLFGGGDQVEHVETSAAALRDVTQVVTASGKVQPEVEVKISPDVSGEIIGLQVREGDAVRQGDLLVRIRPDFYAAQVEQARAGVLQAQAGQAQRKADLMKAELDRNRQKELFDRQVVSESDYQASATQYEVAQAAYEAAEYAVQSAQARLQEAEEQLGKTRIYAPITGTVSQLNVELGERVVGTSQMAGTEMMRLAQLDRMELEVDVNENDVVNVSLGDTAAVEIDAYPERTFRGVVTEIANSARITGAGSQEQVTNFPVKVRLVGDQIAAEGENAEEGVTADEVPVASIARAMLRPGMSGTVDIFTQTTPRAIAIPIQAVTVRDFSEVMPADSTAEEEGPDAEKQPPGREDLRKVVFLVEEGKARMVEVETGIADDTHVVVTSGLKEGDLVITGPYRLVSRELEPGMEVETVSPDGPPITAAR